MKRLILLRSAVEQLIAGSASYPLVDADEWKTMQMVVDLLQPIYDATLALQERMTTAAGILPLYFTIMQKQAPATGLVRMHDAIIGGLNKRMEGWRENRLLVIATVLDPRRKLSQFAEGDRRSIQEMLESVALEKCAEGGTESHASSVDDVEGEDLFMKFISSAEPVATPGQIWIDRPSSTAKAKIEIIEYLKERTYKGNPFHHWHKAENAARFPLLRSLALAYLSAPATTVESERLFSHAGAIFSPKRQRMTANTLQRFLFLNRNVHLV